jgi:hypothetical protein
MTTPQRLHIVVATPVYGNPEQAQVTVSYATLLYTLARNHDIEPLACLPAHGFFGNDLVRARSRFLAAFLRGAYSHLLFWDADVTGKPEQLMQVIGGMVRAHKDIVGCPYPKKRIRWDRVDGSRDPEEQVYDYSFDPMIPPAEPDETGCIPCEGVATGFMLIARECAEKMVAHYRDELYSYDPFDDAEVVQLFQLMFTEVEGKRILLSEDYSFCQRWRKMGGDVHLYAGEGAPLGHVGSHVFLGKRDGFLLRSGT